MISTHCPLHYNGPAALNQGQSQQPPPPHMYAQHPQMRLPQMPGGQDMAQNQRINPQQQQQQQHHQLPPQNPGGDQQMRINHHSKGMMMGVGKAMPNNGKPSDHYPPKVNHQYRKYNSPVATNTLRVDSNAKGFSTMVDTHIPTVSANGIPGAAETTVSNLRTTASSSSSAASVPVPNGTILSNSATEDKGGALDGMLGKEKTAMCLVNELSRYNKLTQQYRLTNEQGPAHQKRFTVTLTLGKEEYTAEGGSIKKAQHAAASEAIQKTKYRHPPAKAHPVRSESVNLTPTVELNALAMKRREKAVYIFDTPPMASGPMGNAMGHHGPLPGAYVGGVGGQPGGHYGVAGNSPNFAYRGMNGMPPNLVNARRFPGSGAPHLGEMSHTGMGVRGRAMMKAGISGGRMMRGGVLPGAMGMMMGGALPAEQVHVTLEVGGMQFTGYGFTAQAARHNAASKALEVLRKMPTDGQQAGGAGDAAAVGDESGVGEGAGASERKPDSKSPVSMIHEMALKRSLTPMFSVKNETGPSHMKVFFTLCTVGDILVEGQGNSKKASKKHAAEKMYQELLKLPPIQGGPGPDGSAGTQHKGNLRPKKKPQETVKKKPKQIIKPDAEPTEELNAISRLMQIQQAKKGKEPVYLLVDQRGTARRREFEMSVEVDGVTMTGTGPNKKLAKRIAAEKLLAVLGYEVKMTSSADIAKEAEGSPARSIKPEKGKNSVESGDNVSAPVVSASGLGVGGTEMAGKKTKVLKKEKGPAAAATEKTSSITREEENQCESGSDGARPKDQLIYLSKIIGFKVQFSDFPKGNHGEYLTLITLNTDPPQLCHGSGKTLDASHDQAALTTLNLLSELGLDNVRPKVPAAPAVSKEKGKGGSEVGVVVEDGK